MFAYIPNWSEPNLLSDIRGAFVANASQKKRIVKKEVIKTREIKTLVPKISRVQVIKETPIEETPIEETPIIDRIEFSEEFPSWEEPPVKTPIIENPIIQEEEPKEVIKEDSIFEEVIQEEEYIEIIPTEENNPIVKDMIELQFESHIVNPYFDMEKIIQFVSPEEIKKDKVEKVQLALIQAADPTKVDTLGLTGSDIDIDFCIIQRFFGGDRGKEIGFTQRMIYLQMKERSPEEDAEMKIIFEGYEAKESFKNFIKNIK